LLLNNHPNFLKLNLSFPKWLHTQHDLLRNASF
jgi:hypothetical protein